MYYFPLFHKCLSSLIDVIYHMYINAFHCIPTTTGRIHNNINKSKHYKLIMHNYYVYSWKSESYLLIVTRVNIPGTKSEKM